MSIGQPVAAAAAGEEEAGGGRKKLILVMLLVVALVAGAAWWFMLRPASAQEGKPEPGAVVKLDAIQVNLAGGHYLRVGIALQASKDAPTDLDGSKALDATIELFSGESVDTLAKKPARDRLKHKLESTLEDVYDGEVIGVYFTDFVTQ
jgi:flagellar FliL protein